NVVATVPLGQVKRRLVGWYVGRHQGGEQARMPLSPSTTTSRTSAAVSATSARRRLGVRDHAITCSAPTLVLPQPRPERMSHTFQAPGGGNWLGRAQNCAQSYSSAASCSGVSCAKSASRSASGTSASRLAGERLVAIGAVLSMARRQMLQAV